MSAHDDWAAGWHAGAEHAEASVDANPYVDDSSDIRAGDIPTFAQPRPAASHPGDGFSSAAWERGFNAGYASITGAAGASDVTANPYSA